MFGLLCHTADITVARTWLAAVAAVLTADVIGWVCVSTVIAWHGGEHEALTTIIVGIGTAIANTSLALAAGLLIHFSSAAAILLVAIGGRALRRRTAATARSRSGTRACSCSTTSRVR